MFHVGDRVTLPDDTRVWVVVAVHPGTDGPNTYDLKLESDGSVHQMGVPEGGMKIAS